MSSLIKVNFKVCDITPEQEVTFTKGESGLGVDGTIAESIVCKITEIIYYEDILSPAVTLLSPLY